MAGRMNRSPCQPSRLKIENSRRPRGLPTGPGTAVLLMDFLGEGGLGLGLVLVQQRVHVVRGS